MITFQLGRALQVGHIAASCGLSDGKAADLLALYARRHDSLLQLFTAMVVHRRQSDGGAPCDAPLKANGSRAAHLIVHNQFMEVVRLEAPWGLAEVLLGPGPSDAQGQGALLACLQVPCAKYKHVQVEACSNPTRPVQSQMLPRGISLGMTPFSSSAVARLHAPTGVFAQRTSQYIHKRTIENTTCDAYRPTQSCTLLMMCSSTYLSHVKRSASHALYFAEPIQANEMD